MMSISDCEAMERFKTLPPVSLVVIGHNEAPNLINCFQAIRELDYPKEKLEIIYVDSGSTDGSVEIAYEFAEKIVSKPSAWYTAGLARNLGIEESSQAYIHFIDGDIQIDKEYLINAIEFLVNHNDIAAVTGFYEETNHSFWNKILNYRRDDGIPRNEGYTTNTSGGGTYRKAALLAVDGYDERIKKGQESELGARLRQRGYKIWFIPIKQGKHNFDINNTWQMLKRFFGDGVSTGYLTLLASREKQNHYIQSYKKNGVRILSTYTSLVIFLLVGFVTKSKTPLTCMVMFVLINLFNIARKKQHSIRYKIYRLVVWIFQPVSFLGILYFFFMHMVCVNRRKEMIGSKMKLRNSAETAHTQ